MGIKQDKPLTKGKLAITLSKLVDFDKPKASLEQYPIDSENCSSLLWHAYMLGDIQNKIVLDLGCGTGKIGIGAMTLGTKQCYFVDIDPDSLKLTKLNISNSLSAEAKRSCQLILKNSAELKRSDVPGTETILSNPPFGVQKEHADRRFLQTAFSLAEVVYSIHKRESRKFLEGFSTEHGFQITHCTPFLFPLKQSQSFHTRRIHNVECIWIRFQKIQKHI